MTPFEIWAVGTLAGIAAPVDAVNMDTLWAWSGSESGNDRMRWNNPLNTTQELLAGDHDIDPDMNRVGVESYPNVPDGITATVVTLLNGRYPTIVGHLRSSVPRQRWQDACGELGTWGTGCGWLASNFGAAPQVAGGEDDMFTDEDRQYVHDTRNAQVAFLGTNATDKVVMTLPELVAKLAELNGRLELIEQSPAIGAEHTTPPGP